MPRGFPQREDSAAIGMSERSWSERANDEVKDNCGKLRLSGALFSSHSPRIMARTPYSSRNIALAFFASGWMTAAAAFLLPGPLAPDWVRTCLFIYGSTAILFGGGTALFRHFDVRAKEKLARGEDIIARWRVDATKWQQFVAADRAWNQMEGALSNELWFPEKVSDNGIEVIVGKNAVQIDQSIHRLTSGMPEVTSAALHDLEPAVIELQLYYPGGGYGASGVPRAPTRSALRFPVGAGAWKEAETVVAHYRGDTPRKADFFHGKGDGTNPEDLTRCYQCGYETYKLMSHCPECGRSMQSKRWSRRYGWILLVLGLAISAVIGMVLLVIGPALLERSSGLRFSGSARGGKASSQYSRGGGVIWNHGDVLWALANRDRATEQMGHLLHDRLLRICVAGGAVP